MKNTILYRLQSRGFVTLIVNKLSGSAIHNNFLIIFLCWFLAIKPSGFVCTKQLPVEKFFFSASYLRKASVFTVIKFPFSLHSIHFYIFDSIFILSLFSNLGVDCIWCTDTFTTVSKLFFTPDDLAAKVAHLYNLLGTFKSRHLKTLKEHQNGPSFN